MDAIQTIVEVGCWVGAVVVGAEAGADEVARGEVAYGDSLSLCT